MKIIGIELRYRHPMCEKKEIAMFSCDIPLPPLEDHQYFLSGMNREIDITVHTSEGDVSMLLMLPRENPESKSIGRKLSDWFDRVRT